MIKIGLLTMPQSTLAFPSIGLTQIASVLKKEYGNEVKADIFYPCLDFAEFVGVNNYLNLQPTGLMQWLFRKEAFPEAEDNTDFLKEYFFQGQVSTELDKVFNQFLEIKGNINQYLDLIIEKYNLLDYDIMGLSSCFSQNIPSFALARKIKEKNPACIIVMGGPNCDYPMGKAVVDYIDVVDYVFSGPGIVAFSKFIGSILNGDKEGVHKINGLFSKKNNVKGHENNKNLSSGDDYWVNQRGDYHDINTCIELDYDSFLADYHSFREKNDFPYDPVMLFETARGCWKKDGIPCTFCGLNDPGICFESIKPELAISHIQKLVDKYSKSSFLFFCIDNILDKKYIRNVFPFLKLPDGVWIQYETSSTLSREAMATCSEYGIKLLQPGIESFNTAELKLMQKAVTAFTNLQFLKHCAEVGIYPIWNYLYAVPGNTDDSNYENIEELLPLVRHLPPPASLAPIAICRYSIFEQKADEYGLELDSDEYSTSIYPFPKHISEEFLSSFVNIAENREYEEIASRFIPNINFEVVDWISSYRQEEDIPKLCFLDENRIFDSRFDIDDPDEYKISDLERKILLTLNRPLTLNELKAELSDIPSIDIITAFEKVKNRKFLFNENYKYLNLVCSECKWDKVGFERAHDFIKLSTAAAF